MKKDRNSFFGEASYLNQQTYPNPNMAPFATTSFANQGFYAGPIGGNMNYNPNIPLNKEMPDYSDIEARLSKIERQINRLDIRLNKLETNGF